MSIEGVSSYLVAQPATNPESDSAAIAHARSLLEQKDYFAAEKALRSLLAVMPGSAEGHFLLGFALLHEVKPAESLAEYTQGAALKKPGPEELAAVASDYVLLNDYADADHWLTLAASIDPARPHTWYLLGRTQYNENHFLDAEKSFLACLKLSPRDVKAEYNLGLVYEALQRPTDATAAYQAAIDWQKDLPVTDPQPYLDLGMLLRRQGRVAEALPLLVTAAPASSRNPLAHQELGLAYEQLGDYNKAAAEIQIAIALAPGVGALHFFLGRIYRKSGKQAQAAQEFGEASKLAGTKTAAEVPNQDQPE